MAVTVMELATYVLGREAENGQDYMDAGLPMIGGCQVCEATIACYNAYPSKSGYLRCADCLGGEGYDTVEEAKEEVFA